MARRLNVAWRNGEAPPTSQSARTITSSDLQHQTSQGNSWRLRCSETRSNMWGGGGWMKKTVTICCPRRANHILPIARTLHHASFHGITAHLWSQTEGSQLWSRVKQHKDDKWEILLSRSSLLKVFYKIAQKKKLSPSCLFPKKQSQSVLCQSKRKTNGRSFSENVV